MTIHHFVTLLPILLRSKWDGPHRWYDLQLAALFSESVNNLRCLLKQSHYLRKHPNLDRGLQLFCTVMFFSIRLPSMFIGMAMIPGSGIQGSLARVMIIAYLFYMTYITRGAYRRLKNTDILQIDGSGVFRIRLGDNFNITSTSLLTGIAIPLTQISVVALYNSSKTDPTPATSPELIKLTWNLLLAVGVGLVGSKVVVPFLQHFVKAQRASSVYLQLGIMFAI